jgi:predicted transcriptional regulator
MAETDNLIQLTADIVSSMVGHNNVVAGDVPALIKTVHSALSALGAPEPEPEIEKPKGAVSARASIKPDGLISMIDGKKYQTLRRHITRHGYTPESYRATFGLPRDYPLTSSNYSELRRGMAKMIGLGRKGSETIAEPATPAGEAANENAAPEPAKRGRKPRASQPSDDVAESKPVETPEAAVDVNDAAPDPLPAETAAPDETPKPKRGRPRKASAATDENSDGEPADPPAGEDAPAPRKRRSKKAS